MGERSLSFFLLPWLLLSAQQVGRPADAAIRIPDPDVGVQTLQARRAAQLRAAAGYSVFHAFQFSDRLAESGIEFRHRITDDSGKSYKPNHYDHGNSVNIADVDGDGLYDIYFVSQLGPNELWRNLGGGRFENITDRAGVGLADRVSVAASFGDFDNDADADLFVTTVKMGNVLFENDGSGRFRDISAAAGVDHVGHSSGSAFVDFDNDGLLDLFVTNVGVYTTDERGPGGYFVGVTDAFQGHLTPERWERSILYRNLGGGRFEDVTEAMGIVDESFNGDVTFADLDEDGRLDIYLTNMQGDDHYWVQRGDGFVEATADFFPVTPWGTMGVKFFDWNNDGRFDLILSDMHSDMLRGFSPQEEKVKVVVTDRAAAERTMPGFDNNVLGNAFFNNTGDGPLREVSDEVGAENYWPWGLSVGDLNADGFEDVFLASSMNFPYRYGINSVLLNDSGERFVDAEFALGVEPRRGNRTDTLWYRLDCAGPDRGHFYCEDFSGILDVRANLGSRASVIFDLEGDGDLDIVTGEFNSEPQVLVSDLAERTELNYLQVRLVGSDSNRDGLGAVVRVTAGGATYTKRHDGKSGYMTQSSMPLYFGLGAASTVDRIEIRWPSGAGQVLEGPIQANRTLEINEG